MNLDWIMENLKKGDTSNFKVLYAATSKAVYFVALSILKDTALAEDTMQNTYIKVLEKANLFQKGSNAKAWVVAIARNLALNLHKQRSKEAVVDEMENQPLFGSKGQDHSSLTIGQVQKLLSQQEFEIVMMIVVQGYKRREVAEILNMPVGTVTWKYKNAINLLKEKM